MTEEQQAEAEVVAFASLLPLVQRHQDRAMRIFQRYKVSSVAVSIGVSFPVDLVMHLTFDRRDSGVACPVDKAQSELDGGPILEPTIG